MPRVYAIGSHIISALGMDAAAHWQAARTGRTGIMRYEDSSLSQAPFMAAKADMAQWHLGRM